jgi:hypothetical protein
MTIAKHTACIAPYAILKYLTVTGSSPSNFRAANMMGSTTNILFIPPAMAVVAFAFVFGGRPRVYFLLVEK